jgi:ribosomal protein S18 acetylase RimI-like enzyme
MIELSKLSLGLREFVDDDIDFLKKVYFSVREDEMKQVGHWTDEMKLSFLTHQFNAQHTHYQQNYTEAKYWVIEQEKEGIGRLYYDESGERISIIDIALLPECRGKGLGEGILKAIFERAKAIEKNIEIHVESFNPAMRLYFRLGFNKISETNGVYHLLEWNYKQ